MHDKLSQKISPYLPSFVPLEGPQAQNVAAKNCIHLPASPHGAVADLGGLITSASDVTLHHTSAIHTGGTFIWYPKRNWTACFSLERNFEEELCQATSERSSLMELDEVSLPKVTCNNFGWGFTPLSTGSTSTFLAQKISALARGQQCEGIQMHLEVLWILKDPNPRSSIDPTWTHIIF